jgi:putative component of toxin-antitoxin plasmid stabilization module
MQSQPRELRVYETETGKIPFLIWLDSLRDRRARAKIKDRLDRVAMGNLGAIKCRLV